MSKVVVLCYFLSVSDFFLNHFHCSTALFYILRRKYLMVYGDGSVNFIYIVLLFCYCGIFKIAPTIVLFMKLCNEASWNCRRKNISSRPISRMPG